MNGFPRITRVPALSLRLLGEFRLLQDGAPVTGLDGARLQSLLAYLVLHSDVPQSRTRVAFLLWPDSTEAQAHTNLRKLIYLLRNVLLDANHYLMVERHTLLWRGSGFCAIDVQEYKAALARAEQAERRMDGHATRIALEEAISLYSGDLLPGCYDEWVLAEREYLSQMYLGALERLLCLWEEAGNYAAAIAIGQRLLREDPLQEASYCHLIRLYTASGNHAAAARTYQNCVRTLERELAVEPSQATRLALRGQEPGNLLWNYMVIKGAGSSSETLYVG